MLEACINFFKRSWYKQSSDDLLAVEKIVKYIYFANCNWLAGIRAQR